MRTSTFLPAALLGCALLLTACTETQAPDTAPAPTTSASAGSTSKATPRPIVTTPKVLPKPTRFPTVKPDNGTARMDLANWKISVSAYAKDHNGTLPKTVGDAIKAYGPRKDNNTMITGYEVDQKGGTFCITGASPGGTLYTITTNTEVKAGGLCPADKTAW